MKKWWATISSITTSVLIYLFMFLNFYNFKVGDLKFNYSGWDILTKEESLSYFDGFVNAKVGIIILLVCAGILFVFGILSLIKNINIFKFNTNLINSIIVTMLSILSFIIIGDLLDMCRYILDANPFASNAFVGVGVILLTTLIVLVNIISWFCWFKEDKKEKEIK